MHRELIPTEINNHQKSLRLACRETEKKVKIPVSYRKLKKSHKENNVFLFTTKKNEWLALKPIARNGELGVLVWLAWSKEESPMLKYSQELDVICSYIGARFLEFYSVRSGFRRIAEKFGYEEILKKGNSTLWRKRHG